MFWSDAATFYMFEKSSELCSRPNWSHEIPYCSATSWMPSRLIHDSVAMRTLGAETHDLASTDAPVTCTLCFEMHLMNRAINREQKGKKVLCSSFEIAKMGFT